MQAALELNQQRVRNAFSRTLVWSSYLPVSQLTQSEATATALRAELALLRVDVGESSLRDAINQTDLFVGRGESQRHCTGGQQSPQ